MFNVGERVICVDAFMQLHIREEILGNMPNWVVKDQKYTIRGFTDNEGIVCGIWLEELRNKPVTFKLLGGKLQEPAFATWRFRKLEPAELQAEVVENVEELKLVA